VSINPALKQPLVVTTVPQEPNTTILMWHTLKLLTYPTQIIHPKLDAASYYLNKTASGINSQFFISRCQSKAFKAFAPFLT
jgi:hypothetical protein